VLFKATSAKKNLRRLTAPAFICDTSCMKALRRVKGFWGVSFGFFEWKWTDWHTRIRVPESDVVVRGEALRGSGIFLFSVGVFPLAAVGLRDDRCCVVQLLVLSFSS